MWKNTNQAYSENINKRWKYYFFILCVVLNCFFLDDSKAEFETSMIKDSSKSGIKAFVTV